MVMFTGMTSDWTVQGSLLVVVLGRDHLGCHVLNQDLVHAKQVPL